jgi:copper(I)-binding protein
VSTATEKFAYLKPDNRRTPGALRVFRCQYRNGTKAISVYSELTDRASTRDFAMRRSPLRCLCTAWLLGFGAATASVPANALFIVNQPWVRPAKTAQSTEAYMDLTSIEGATLVAVRADVARTVSIRAPGSAVAVTTKVTLPPRVLVALAPGQYRIAFSHLLRTLQRGDRVELTLTLEQHDGSRQEIVVNAEVREHSPIDDERHAHEHEHTHPPE